MRQPVSDVEKLVAINEIREVMAHYARYADHKRGRAQDRAAGQTNARAAVKPEVFAGNGTVLFGG